MGQEKIAYDMDTLSEIKKAREALLKDYRDGDHSFEMSRLKQDLRLEVELQNNYRGREVFELLQNADDAGATTVSMTIDGNRLVICNNGDPFSASGFQSIMMPYSSTKFGSEGKGKIGQKGLGFRSVLNWTNAVEIQSGGVCLSFPEGNAKIVWEEKIKNHLSGEMQNRLMAYAGSVCKRESPVPFLSIPEEPKPCPPGETSVYLQIREDDLNGIEGQINGFHSHTLLFLNNLLEVDLPKRTIRVLRESIDDSEYSIVTVSDTWSDGSKVMEKWLLLQKKTDSQYGDCELAIAYPLGHEYKGGFIYSFFPTQIWLDLPCIVNGTFELDSSRNSITSPSPQNDFMMSLIAKALGELSEYLVRDKSRRNNDWDPFRLLYLPNNGTPALEKLCSCLAEERNVRSVYPTVDALFKNRNSVYAFSENLAVFLRQEGGKQVLDNHLIPGYSSYFNNCLPDWDFESLLERYAWECAADEDLAKWIHSLYESKLSCRRKLSILRDDNDSFIESTTTAHLAEGERFKSLPDFVPINYVKDNLQKALLAFDWQSGQKSDVRNLNACLASLVAVTVADIAEVKKKIVALEGLKKGTLSDDQYKGLIISLFETYQNKSSEPFDPREHLRLRAMDKSFQDATSLLLHMPNTNKQEDCKRWVLDWNSAWFDSSIPRKEVEDFLVDVLGVSRYVPRVYEYFGNDRFFLKPLIISDSRPSEKFQFSEQSRGNLNQAFRLIPDFFDVVADSPVSLILQSEECYKDMTTPTTVSFLQKSVKTLPASESYMSYCWKRDSDQFKGMILSELSDEALAGMGSPKELVRSVLIALGAHERYDGLSIEELYGKLKSIGDKSNARSVRGVMREYQQIRRALDAKSPIDETVRQGYLKELNVFAVYDGRIELKDHNEVYYWDNDRLPASILDHLPKLYIGNREGAQSVCRIFGVKSVDSIEYTIIPTGEECEGLEEQLRVIINEKLPYLLAIRCKNAVKDLTANFSSISGLSFKIYRSIELESKDIELFKGSLPPYGMVSKDAKTFYICCPYGGNLEQVQRCAIDHDVDFWENIAEAVCIAFKVRGDDNMSSFRSILKESRKENDIFRKKEIPIDVWNETLTTIGMDEQEKEFWMYLSDDDAKWVESLNNSLTRASILNEIYPGVGFEKFIDKRMPGIKDLLSSDLVYRLVQSLVSKKPAVLGKLPGGKGLYDYYFSRLRKIREDYHSLYCSHLYERCRTSRTEQPHYLDNCTSFVLKDAPLEEIAANIQMMFKTEEELCRLFKQMYGLLEDTSPVDVPSAPLEQYADLIKGIDWDSIPNKLGSLLLFCGNADEVSALVAQYKSDEKKQDEFNAEDVRIRFGCFEQTAPPKSNGAGNGSFPSDAAVKRAGKRAEVKVMEKLKTLKGVTDVQPWSKKLNPTGFDGKHFDIQYKLHGIDHYLEVKSKSGSRIIMSKGEFDFANEEKHKDIYDLAIVEGDDIKIWLRPFRKGLQGDSESVHSYAFYLK